MKTRLLARIQPLDAQDARSRDPQLEDLVAFLGYRPNALLTMARKPGVVPLLLQLMAVTLRGEGLLPEPLRFLIAAETARTAQCRYTTTHLVHAAHHLGITWEKLAALPRFPDDDHFNDREKKALAVARAGGSLPVRAPALAMEQAKTVFSDEEVVEIVSCVAMVGWFNRWNGLIGSVLEVEPSEAMAHVHWLSELEV